MMIGYARVSTTDQSPDHQIDALVRSGVARQDIYLDVASGAKASRPHFDVMMRVLRAGDTLTVTRLDRLGRSVLHLVMLGAQLRERGIGLHVLEQGIDTTTAEGRAMFGMLSVLAEYQRELIVANTQDGLAAARARGRVGGRPAILSADQAALAQRLYDAGDHTVQQIADMLGVRRSTLYGYLSGEDQEYVLVVWRNERPKVDDDGRPYGETGQSEAVQLEADAKWWRISPARAHLLRGMVYVSDGVVTRIRQVLPDAPPVAQWPSITTGDKRLVTKYRVPLGAPLYTPEDVAAVFPTLPFTIGDPKPAQRGRLWETVSL